MTIKEFQQDLRNGMTLNDALLKHELTFKEAVLGCPRTTTKKPVKTHSPCRNITSRKGRYYIRKKTNNKQRAYGTYKSLEDAVKVRDYCNVHGWDKNRLDEYCRILGVERCVNSSGKGEK